MRAKSAKSISFGMERATRYVEDLENSRVSLSR